MTLTLSRLGLAMLAAAFAASPALAADYPQRPISLLVGYAPGGPVDTGARIFARYLGEKIGQTVVVENKAGASGMIAAEATRKADPDGYVLNFVASPTMTITPLVQRNDTFDPRKDFTPVGLVSDYTNVLLVGNELPVKDVQELVAYARANPTQVSFGSAGVGASNHLSAELLRQKTDTDMLHVPYRGNAPAMIDVMSGKVSFMFDISSTAKGFVEGGKARALAVTSRERNAQLPDVPTMIEAGVPDFEVVGWYAVIGPKGMPEASVKRLTTAMEEVRQEPAFQKAMAQGGLTLLEPDPKTLQDRIDSDYTLWEKVIEAGGITAQ